jgi:2-phosphosulfolactate phosphatase
VKVPVIHVLTNRNHLEAIRMPGTVAIVVDVLLATTGITIALQRGAAAVIPTLNPEEALTFARALSSDSVVLVGELNSEPIEGFVAPWPQVLMATDLTGKTVVYSTTNGTVALRMAAQADLVIAAGLINGAATAEYVLAHAGDRNVVLVCAGNGPAFSLEDFYGAGYVASLLAAHGGDRYEFTDAALAARLLQDRTTPIDCLTSSHTGRHLAKLRMEGEIAISARENICSVVPVLRSGRLVSAGDHF